MVLWHTESHTDASYDPTSLPHPECEYHLKQGQKGMRRCASLGRAWLTWLLRVGEAGRSWHLYGSLCATETIRTLCEGGYPANAVRDLDHLDLLLSFQIWTPRKARKKLTAIRAPCHVSDCHSRDQGALRETGGELCTVQYSHMRNTQINNPPSACLDCLEL